MPIDKSIALQKGKAKELRELPCTKPVRPAVIQAIQNCVRMPRHDFSFVTITLNPKLFSIPVRKQYDCTVLDVKSILNYVCLDYTLITELTEEGNVHYHAWATFKEKCDKKRFKELFRSNARFGFTKISKDRNDVTVLQQQEFVYNYLRKDIGETYIFLRTNFVHNKDDDIVFHHKQIAMSLITLDVKEYELEL